MKPARNYKSIQVWDGRWYAAKSPELTQCCDCGLVHNVEYQLHNGRLIWRVKVDKKATRVVRAEQGIKVTRAKG